VASVTSWVPLCMDASEFASWRQMNLRVVGNNQAKRPCDDCPLGFAAEMRGIGRCNGSPGGVEEEDEMEIKELKAKASVVSVQVAVPCERCTHREVCGIRQQIADLDSVEMELPALNPALKPAADDGDRVRVLHARAQGWPSEAPDERGGARIGSPERCEGARGDGGEARGGGFVIRRRLTMHTCQYPVPGVRHSHPVTTESVPDTWKRLLNRIPRTSPDGSNAVPAFPCRQAERRRSDPCSLGRRIP
jgi:hypothetical protein